VTYGNLNSLTKYCFSNDKDCKRKSLLKKFGCNKSYIDRQCRNKEVSIKTKLEIKIDDLIDKNYRKYFTIISYNGKSTKNPIISDNKLQILSEKISYNI
jgi:hypothetical protein